MLPYSGAKLQSRFYPGNLVTRTGDRVRFILYPGDSRIIQESSHVCNMHNVRT